MGHFVDYLLPHETTQSTCHIFNLLLVLGLPDDASFLNLADNVLSDGDRLGRSSNL